MNFKLTSDYKPTGDQPQAISELIKGIRAGEKFQILQGVTGSGKTFTIANVIEQLNRPVLVLSHNKTLAAQLYGEFKSFFPKNAVEYFVSYYDYYQPEAYLPSSNTYIEKDLSINEEIEKLRLSTTTSLLTGRRDVIVVSSVSCLYGIGNPEDFYSNLIEVKTGSNLVRNKFLRDLVSSLYSRNDLAFNRGNFRVSGDTVDIFPAYSDTAIRVSFWGEEVDEILTFNPIDGHTIDKLDYIRIYPASIFMTTKERLNKGIDQIVLDMGKQVEYFKEVGKHLEAKRIEDRVTYDVEMIKELGYCSGIENYSRYFDGRKQGSRPFCLLDYFPEDFIVVIDESHVTLPQVHAMYGGDRSRKQNLVEYGFRLPAAMDNRPLKFEEFEAFEKQTIYLSATPSDYEYKKTEGVVVEQVIRPTGLIDPSIDVRPSLNQIDDLVAEINLRAKINERVLVTTLTKRMAEELAEYFDKIRVRSRYIHSDVDTVERVQIMEDLRRGLFDVLIGVNLLREGLDLPEVSLVAILDADKEGFLRSERSLTQTAGRAARNINGKVIMYADKVTKSMQKTIDETDRRMEKQLKYNEKHNITPTQIKKEIGKIQLTGKPSNQTSYYDKNGNKSSIAADPVIKYMSATALEQAIKNTKAKMLKAAEDLDFTSATVFRNELEELQKLLVLKD
ncbi:MAG: excinuclease ABC subunit UvrB [Bacteroidales bacterium]|nr:excinuclease ABC subunit UvrB [Bacteroidales bacterium]